jgi:hypothetical protein
MCDAGHRASVRDCSARCLERIAQNVGRLALAYALSALTPDVHTPAIRFEDVLAALAVGDLSERTVLALWSEAPGDRSRPGSRNGS